MRQFFIYTFFISTHLAFAQDPLLDSLYQVLKDHPREDTTRVRILLGICFREYTSYPEKSKTHAEEILRISQATGFGIGTGGGLRYMAEYYWFTGSYGKATEYAYKMLRAFEAISDERGMGRAYQVLGKINEDGNGDLEKTKTFYMQGLQHFEKANSKRDIGYSYNSLGVLYYNHEKFDEALEYLLKSLAVRNEIHHEDGLSQTYSNLAHVFMGQKKYSQALHYFEMAISFEEKQNNVYRLVGNYSGKGEIYIYTGDYAKAEHYLFRSIELAKESGQKKMLEQIYDKMILLEKSRNRYEAATKYVELRLVYKDSIYTEETSRQIAQFEAQFETEKKEQAIQLLERDKRIQTLWINIFIVAFVLLAIFSVMGYFIQRFRERKNREVLNLKIENLLSKQNELSEKYKDILIADTEDAIESADQRLLKKAIEVVESNMSNPQFGVEEMGKEMAMSRSQLHRKIKIVSRVSPSDFIRNIRLRKAAVLLLNQSNTVSQIGFQVGFQEHSNFSKSFKKQFGVSPSEYSQSRNRPA